MRSKVAGSNGQPLIEVQGLCVDYWSEDHWTNVVDRIGFEIEPGEAMGLVGESGCGKTTAVYSMLGYTRPNSRIREGQVLFEGQDLLGLSAAKLQRIRGRQISLVPQNPTTALSPSIRVGQQVTETLQAHSVTSSSRQARQKTLDLFRLVALPTPDRIFDRYPHQLSGGQQQRVIIAMALACDPQLVLLDEPTTGLDVTTQAQILDLLKDLRSEQGLAMLYVTHNLGVVAQICDRIGVMYAGRIVEVAPTLDLFHNPQHPYTQGLIAAVPRISTPSRTQALLLKGLLRRSELPPGCPFAPRCEFARSRCLDEPQELAHIGDSHQVACWLWEEVPPFSERLASPDRLIAPETDVQEFASEPSVLRVEKLSAGYSFKREWTTLKKVPKVVVEGVSLDVRPGETFALVGESGSGKTTVARALNGFLPYVDGLLELQGGHDLKGQVEGRSDELLRTIQLVFQNPDASLNPRQRVSQIIGRPLRKFRGMSGTELRREVERLLEDVRLDAGYYNRFPDELSGGERQRVALARALAARPKLLLCDEILSGLDVSVQANILKLLVDLQAEHGIAYLFISHDLAVVRSLAHRVGVLYWGALCETGTIEEVFAPPHHPYTFLLLSSIPEADPEQELPPVRKDIGLITEEPRTACPFAPRCPWKVGTICEETAPPWQQTTETHKLRCHIPIEQLLKLQE
jgi:peptide/nickel transport system ATP-binding protein